ncbi:MAG: histidine phosphatase family protein [Acetobacterales bacterium]
MILVRHCQSEFNAAFSRTRVDPGIADPGLTREGRMQAAGLGQSLAGKGIDRIVTSPYRRALQTAGTIAAALEVPVEINPLVRERAAFVCDIGTPASELARDWPAYDFSHIEEIWWPALEESEHEVQDRARLFCGEIVAAGVWESMLVVSHWGFIRQLTGQRVENGAVLRFDPRALAVVPDIHP